MPSKDDDNGSHGRTDRQSYGDLVLSACSTVGIYEYVLYLVSSDGLVSLVSMHPRAIFRNLLKGLLPRFTNVSIDF